MEHWQGRVALGRWQLAIRKAGVGESALGKNKKECSGVEGTSAPGGQDQRGQPPRWKTIQKTGHSTEVLFPLTRTPEFPRQSVSTTPHPRDSGKRHARHRRRTVRGGAETMADNCSSLACPCPPPPPPADSGYTVTHRQFCNTTSGLVTDPGERRAILSVWGVLQSQSLAAAIRHTTSKDYSRQHSRAQQCYT